MNDNYFEKVNNELYGKTCFIGDTNYTFLCFYIYNPSGQTIVMLQNYKDGSIEEFVLTNGLGLKF